MKLRFSIIVLLLLAIIDARADGINNPGAPDGGPGAFSTVAVGGCVPGTNALCVTGSSALGITTATSLALGGATIGSNALAVTGTTALGGATFLGGNTQQNTGYFWAQQQLLVGSGGNGVSNQILGTSVTTTSFKNASGDDNPFSISIGATSIISHPTLANSAIQFGALDAASPVAQTLQFQNGSGTNIAGVNATVVAPLATGTGTNGDYIIQTGVKTISGATLGTKTTALTIKGETQNVIVQGLIQLLGTSASFPAIKRSGTDVAFRTADDANDTNITVRNVTASNQVISQGAAILANSNTATTAGGVFALQTGSTGSFGLFYGSGAPTLSAAQGSLYLRSDGVPQYNTNGLTGWAQIGSVLTLTNVATTSAVCYNPATGVLTYDGTLGTCTVSTIAAKNLKAPLTNKEGFDMVMAMQPWRYDLKKDRPTYKPGEQIGFIAEYALKDEPRLVATSAGGKVDGFLYEQYTAALTAAIKYQQDCLDSWKCRLFGVR
jgi:hypothetical protein